MHKQADPDNIVDYSEEFKDLFVKMMQINPRERPNMHEVRNHPWFKG